MENQTKEKEEIINVALVQNVKANGFGIASLVFSIVGFLTAFLGVGMFFAIISVILAVAGLAVKDRKRGKAIAGLVIGIMSFLIAGIALLFFDALGTAVDDTVKKTKKIVIVNDDGTEKEISNDTKIKVGSTVKMDNLEIKYIKFNNKVTNYEEYEAPEKGEKYISVEFEFKNIGDNDKYISYTDFKCYVDDYSVDNTYIGDDLLDATLSKGKKAKGNVYFKVKGNYNEILIEYTPNFFIDSAKARFECK